MSDTRKTLFEPQDVEELIRGWLLHAHKCRDRHDLTARNYDRLRYWLGLPTTILAVIVGSSVFASLEGDVSLNVRIVVASVSILSAILAGLQTFLNYPARSEAHRIAGVKYKAMIRELEQLFALKFDKPDQNPLDKKSIDDLRRRFDDLEAEAPVVPPSIMAQVEAKYKNVNFIETAAELYRSGSKVAQGQ